MITKRDHSVIFDVGHFFRFLAGNVCDIKLIFVKNVNLDTFFVKVTPEKVI